jgi:hypothetical protein
MNPITSFVHVLTHNHKESLNDCPHRYAHQDEKTKNQVKMPSLLAFLSMFGEQMGVFGVRLQREEE